MNNIRKIFLSLIITLSALFICSQKVEASAGGYYIENYDVNVKVNENNVYEITEIIDVEFEEHRHGIYRYIPLINEVSRADGSSAKVPVRIDDLEIRGDKYSTSKEEGNLVIVIGDEDEYVIGEKIYTIEYTLTLPKDKSDEYDEFYYNLVGTGWDTYIERINFTVDMPKDFNRSNMGVYVGSYGSSSDELVNYKVNGTTISGYTKEPIGAYQGLTVRIVLPEEYYVDEGFKASPLSYIAIVCSVLFLIVAFIIWYIHGKDDVVIETVEFYPPDNLNSLDIGTIYKGKARKEDVISLLIYLASKGYLKIEEDPDDKDEFIFIKLKKYDGKDEQEKKFFNGIFKSKTEVKQSELTNNFYTTVNSILSNKNSKKSLEKIYEKEDNVILFSMLGMIVLMFSLTFLPNVSYYHGWVAGIILTLVSAIFIFIACKIPSSANMGKIKGLLVIVGVLSFIILITIMSLINLFFYIPMLFASTICVLISSVGISIFVGLNSKRTKYGNEMLGKIRGFKDFLEKAEKDKLEKLVEENPTYFYDILPYAYVLGVSDKWAENFESIAIEPAQWYVTSGTFTIRYFILRTNRLMDGAKTSMLSTPAPKGTYRGGSSGGGGFSGGGFGGGGGGSW